MVTFIQRRDNSQIKKNVVTVRVMAGSMNSITILYLGESVHIVVMIKDL